MVRIFSVVLAATVMIWLAPNTRAEDKEKAKPPRLDQLKRLAGDWTGKIAHGEHAQDVTVNYKVTSGGTAVMETIGAGSDHEMITVYHQDGDDLVLTHYCMLGNQPRMKAEKGGDAKKLAFKFMGAGNLKSEQDAHMHDLTMEFLADDHIKATWTLYKDGKADHAATFDLKRKKK